MTSNYRQHGIQGHLGRLFCIVATDDGKYLASGGHDGTRLWDLQCMSEIPGRPAIAGTQGSTTAIAWASRDNDPGETLFYGTVHGHLVCWRQMHWVHSALGLLPRLPWGRGGHEARNGPTTSNNIVAPWALCSADGLHNILSPA
ncbi:hypothetical protein B0H16DRAFT_1481905 [Mycena metata]|uniref:Uncharacterized protein n=1 Tax=Mycena metata TaxID=1033252 RepID=A0AAD7M9G5_9AGAR|nr:hypothetical protein B0H16DRAFT_1481905 [Mycena metata]